VLLDLVVSSSSYLARRLASKCIGLGSIEQVYLIRIMNISLLGRGGGQYESQVHNVSTISVNNGLKS
jgi:hypothetical protein